MRGAPQYLDRGHPSPPMYIYIPIITIVSLVMFFYCCYDCNLVSSRLYIYMYTIGWLTVLEKLFSSGSSIAICIHVCMYVSLDKFGSFK